jgi:hypothetical protein
MYCTHAWRFICLAAVRIASQCSTGSSAAYMAAVEE